MSSSQGSPHQALKVPEILRNIFVQDLGPLDLTVSALVCRQWSIVAAEVLWRNNTPSLCAMQTMHEAGTLSKYICFSKHVHIQCTECEGNGRSWSKKHAVLLKNVAFSSTRAISLKVDLPLALMKPKYLDALLQPHLRCATFLEGHYGDELLDMLEANTPYLESLDLWNRSPELMSWERVITFLANMPSLRCIDGILWNIPNYVVSHLVKRRNLERIAMYGFESPDWVSCLSTASPSNSAFDSLQELEVSAGCFFDDHISRILPMFPNLRVVKLSPTVTSVEIDMISPLASCSRLTDVTVAMNAYSGLQKPVSLHTASLLTFVNACPHLRHVNISCLRLSFHSFPVSQVEFAQLLHSLPNIRTIALPLYCEFGVAEMRTLRDACPHLTSLSMKYSTFNYAEMADCPDPPVLPSITRFIAAQVERRWPSGDPREQALPSAGGDELALREMGAFTRVLPSVRIKGRDRIPINVQRPWPPR